MQGGPFDLTAALLLAASPFVGGFMATVVRRLADGEGDLWGWTTCSGCGAPASLADHFPVAAWRRLGRCCRHCGAARDRMFLIVEIAALVTAGWAAAFLPASQVAAGCGLGWTLLTLAAIDIRRGILPDILTFPLGAAGLLLTGIAAPADLPAHFAGALAGYAAFFAIRELYWRLRGQEGLGLGDVKLLAAAGARVSLDGLPSVILIASMSGLLITVLGTTVGRRAKLEDRLPFGPCLCFSSWVVWVHGPLGFF